MLALLLAATAPSCIKMNVSAASETRIEIMRRRASDWRIGPIVYQVFVDRFAPSANLDEKRKLYAPPRRVLPWSEEPTGGHAVPEVGVYSHELDFWGGDLPSLLAKLEHVTGLADVLYLNPIHEALTNHKYDATDWIKVDPQYGTQADFAALVKALHSQKKHLVLDGVFNHCGRANPMFQEAKENPSSKYRNWFTFDPNLPLGYRAWAGVANLPEVNLENKATRDYLWNAPDSVVAHYLKEGADGWRLDVAHEVGPEYLSELTRAAHSHKPGSLVIGEVWNYPSRWTSSMDGLLNMFMGKFITSVADGSMGPRQANESLKELVADCGIEPLLRSWIVLGNHDTPRLATQIPDPKLRHFAQALQFTLPGAPLIYYGDEIGMKGGGDPAQRAPMKWDEVKPSNPDLKWTRQLISARRKTRALRVGDCRSLVGERLVAFIRTTERPLESTIVLANPSEKPVTESIVVPDPTVMGYTLFKDALSGSELRIEAGVIRPTVPPQSVMIFVIDDEAKGRGQYKRMKDG